MNPAVIALCIAAQPAVAPRPLLYWGARAPVATLAPAAFTGAEAHVEAVDAAKDGAFVVFRLTFDRPVEDVLRLSTGEPVSGRLRAVLHVDSDGERGTGLDEGPAGAHTGADLRIDVGVMALGADPDEGIEARPVVTVDVVALSPRGARDPLLRIDDAGTDRMVVAYGHWIDFRVQATQLKLSPGARLILTDGERVASGGLRF